MTTQKTARQLTDSDIGKYIRFAGIALEGPLLHLQKLPGGIEVQVALVDEPSGWVGARDETAVTVFPAHETAALVSSRLAAHEVRLERFFAGEATSGYADAKPTGYVASDKERANAAQVAAIAAHGVWAGGSETATR